MTTPKLPTSRTWIFWLETAYLVGLGILAWLFVSDRIHPTAEIGTLPTAILWFGALGAVLLSLTGVFEHMRDWNGDYVFWHVARPLVGAAVAVIAVLILQAGILAVGFSAPTASNGTTTPKNLLYYLVAFLVGYREETFRDLVKRLSDVVLSPGGGAVGAAASIRRLLPDTGSAAGLYSVTISGKGLLATKGVQFGTADALYTVDSDTQITAKAPPGDQGQVSVTVLTPTGSATVWPFTYT